MGEEVMMNEYSLVQVINTLPTTPDCRYLICLAYEASAGQCEPARKKRKGIQW